MKTVRTKNDTGSSGKSISVSNIVLVLGFPAVLPDFCAFLQLPHHGSRCSPVVVVVVVVVVVGRDKNSRPT